MNKQQIRTGWDIGGAHLKVAQCDSNGQFLNALELPCPLWQGLNKLENALSIAIKAILPSQDHRITMTGELADIFPNRQAGVATILACLNEFIPSQSIKVYAGHQPWLSLEQAKQQWQQVASKNWLASANFTASQVKHGIFIDVGSTTSDIITIENHQAKPQGQTDFERQISSELHYVGAIRTPLIALAQTVPFNHYQIRIAAELFATTGDCWCLTGELDPTTIQDNSSDGQPWDKPFCINRLARLLGTDAAQQQDESWIDLAHWFCEQQVIQLTESIQTVLNHHPTLPKQAPIIGAGIGRFIIKHCAKKLSRPYLDFSDLIQPIDSISADHAPATALALLADEELT